MAPKKSQKRIGLDDDDDMADVREDEKSDAEVMNKDRSRELVDLTAQQAASGADNIGGLDEMDDFDLLDATIDPTDIKTLSRVRQLHMEIEYEKAFISCKQAYKWSMKSEDPMKIME